MEAHPGNERAKPFVVRGAHVAGIMGRGFVLFG